MDVQYWKVSIALRKGFNPRVGLRVLDSAGKLVCLSNYPLDRETPGELLTRMMAEKDEYDAGAAKYQAEKKLLGKASHSGT